MKGVDISAVIKVIEDMKLIVWQRTWDTLTKFIGTFIITSITAIGSLGVSIVLEFIKETQYCTITVITLGEEDLIEKSEASVRADIVSMAQNNNWAWDEVEVDSTVIQCPHCLYMHSPLKLKMVGSNIIECKNCGQEFLLGETADIPESDYAGVECPFCGRVSDYTEYEVSWDRKVTCPNCRKTVALESAVRHSPTAVADQYFSDF